MGKGKLQTSKKYNKLWQTTIKSQMKIKIQLSTKHFRKTTNTKENNPKNIDKVIFCQKTL
jgi:hypothetical protein